MLDTLELGDTEVRGEGRICIADSHSCIRFFYRHQVISTVTTHTHLVVDVDLPVLLF